MSTGTKIIRDNFRCVAVVLTGLVATLNNVANAEAWIPVDHTELDVVFIEQSAALSGYHSIIMDPLSVWFGDSDASGDDPDGHLSEFRSAYAAAFSAQLGNQGFDIAEVAGPGVLRVHVEIVDLMVNDYSDEQLEWAERFSFPTEPEHLTLVAEFSDASTGDVLVRIADLGLPNEVQDVWATVRRSFDEWAMTLATVLVEEQRSSVLASR
ncbi:MAG: DUF3313 family protein [Gammaproteobacteria bacterium]